jgi:ankyrin repeat protein
MKLLLEEGAEIELASPDGITLITYAAINGKKEVVQLLFNKGAKYDIEKLEKGFDNWLGSDRRFERIGSSDFKLQNGRFILNNLIEEKKRADRRSTNWCSELIKSNSKE